ncbi:ATP-binding cassette domain-containing protein [Porticoccaceae bacterium LTM1]|nr:ATP-binding cassette domain-containing protein [Porticoccaceae bacterium LTM1]
MIRLETIELRRGGKALLHDASATIHPGQRVGLVGANGCGKSTLFAMLRGELEVDQGSVSFPSEWRIADVAQETPALERTVLDHTIDADSHFRKLQQEMMQAEGERLADLMHQFEAIDGYSMEARAGKLLHGLGFSEAEQKRPVKSFSGGWRMRINLARALLIPSELLLLDEPTNHLDLDAIFWLENWLQSYSGTLLLISHDREFLDRVVNGIIHVEHQTLFSYSGNYSSFERQRGERLAQQQAVYEKEQRQKAHLQKYIDKFRYKATKARQAQSRIKALEKLTATAPLLAASGFDFEFGEPAALSSPLISLDQVQVGYGEKLILNRIHLNLQPGARIGLLGPNGAGKSTLIKLLAGQLQPQSGELVRGGNLAVGYFAQHQVEALDMQASPLLHLQRIAPQASEQQLRDFLGGFAFRGDKVNDTVGPFSGGEKARMALALLVWQRPNLLLLDEPTNHLDLDMREALVFAIQSFTGAVVVVSHDRHLLSTVVDEFYLVANGVAAPFDGDLEDYHRFLLDSGRKSENSKSQVTTASVQRKDRKRLEAEFRASVSPIKKEINQLEKQLEKDLEQLDTLEQQLADPSVYEKQNAEKMTRLLKEQGSLKTAMEEREARWLELEDLLETKNSEFQASLA